MILWLLADWSARVQKYLCWLINSNLFWWCILLIIVALRLFATDMSFEQDARAMMALSQN